MAPRTLLPLAVVLLLAAGCGDDERDDSHLLVVRPKRAGLEASLAAAGENRTELEQALAAVDGEQRDAMRFLIEEMPLEDLTTLKADFLIEHVTLAFAAWERAPWRDETPDDLFLHYVVPYAMASEPRRPWRKMFYDVLMPVIADCDTTTEAVYAVNDFIWKHYGVEYTVERERADQAPARTIETGHGSCTCIAIAFTAACRSVGIPMRLCGISWWPHKPGNHSWTEFWDEGDWNCTGAMEGDEAVNETWYQVDAALAQKDNPRHAVYAASFAWTGEPFPMHWADEIPVHGINITDRYVPGPEWLRSR